MRRLVKTCFEGTVVVLSDQVLAPTSGTLRTALHNGPLATCEYLAWVESHKLALLYTISDKHSQKAQTRALSIDVSDIARLRPRQSGSRDHTQFPITVIVTTAEPLEGKQVEHGGD
jgi:hypothetical protein